MRPQTDEDKEAKLYARVMLALRDLSDIAAPEDHHAGPPTLGTRLTQRRPQRQFKQPAQGWRIAPTIVGRSPVPHQPARCFAAWFSWFSSSWCWYMLRIAIISIYQIPSILDLVASAILLAAMTCIAFYPELLVHAAFAALRLLPGYMAFLNGRMQEALWHHIWPAQSVADPAPIPDVAGGAQNVTIIYFDPKAIHIGVSALTGSMVGAIAATLMARRT